MVGAVRALMLATVAAAGLTGCPPSDRAPTTEASRTPLATTVDPHRCVLGARSFAQVPEAVDVAWVLPGPEGPEWVARTTAGGELFWRDAHAEASLPSALGTEVHALAWTGTSFVGVVASRVMLASARFDGLRPARGLVMDHALAVSVAARDGAALVAWLKTDRDDGRDGVPWTALVAADGEVLRAPHPLPSAPAALRDLEARWDFGRFVVQGETVEEPFGTASWVLEPDGAPAWNGPGPVACPRAGCVRLSYAPTPSGTAQALRLTPLADPASAYDTTVFANETAAASVSGDRVLLLTTPPPGEGGCALHVYDTLRRQVSHESSSDVVRCARGSAAAVRGGFVVLESDPARGVGVRALRCGDDA